VLDKFKIHRLWRQRAPFYSLHKANSALLFTLLLAIYPGLCTADDTPSLQETPQETQQQDLQNPSGTDTEPENESEGDKPASQEPTTEAQQEDIPTPVESDTESGERLDPLSACIRTKDLIEQEAAWYDSAHAVVNTAFCEPAVWFDDFFASDRIFEEVGGTYVRWRNDFVYNEEAGYNFSTNLNFSVELPRISSKLKLIFEGDEDPDLKDVLPGDQRESASNTLGLRVDVKDTNRSKFNISLSAKPRVRLRYRYTWPVRDDFLIRFTQEVQNEKGVNGARTRLDLEKAFLPLKLLRSTTELFAAEDFPGVDWAQAFSLFQRLTKKSSASYEASVVGLTRPENLVTNYRLGVRYRQSIHRDWLFLEVSPDITWPIDLSEDRETILKERRSVYSILLRLEVHFGNAKKRKYSDYY
jgi:hypothetical protein